MLVSPVRGARTTDPVNEPMPQSPAAAHSTEVSSTEVLIATQQVVFSTAAAAGIRRENMGRRLLATMRRIFATSTDASRPRSRYVPRRYGFLERSLMAREMERL